MLQTHIKKLQTRIQKLQERMQKLRNVQNAYKSNLLRQPARSAGKPLPTAVRDLQSRTKWLWIYNPRLILDGLKIRTHLVQD